MPPSNIVTSIVLRSDDNVLMPPVGINTQGASRRIRRMAQRGMLKKVQLKEGIIISPRYDWPKPDGKISMLALLAFLKFQLASLKICSCVQAISRIALFYASSILLHKHTNFELAGLCPTIKGWPARHGLCVDALRMERDNGSEGKNCFKYVHSNAYKVRYTSSIGRNLLPTCLVANVGSLASIPLQDMTRWLGSSIPAASHA